jgi:crossover junction endodeoxyribonuclease RuvC
MEFTQMIIIGIDPGIDKVGIGIIEETGQQYKFIHQELIRTNAKETTGDRLKMIHDRLSGILSIYKVDAAAVEKLFFAKNIKTAFIVSEARGVIILTLRLFNIPTYEYTPLQVKQALIGYGRASKMQMQKFIKIFLKLNNDHLTDDAADGLALAVTHINNYKMLSRIHPADLR